jgi:cysteine desulfurase/selenocysteine lyase
MNIQKIRNDFPVLKTTGSDGSPLVYLDNAATVQKPQTVIDSMHAFYSTSYATVHRALYEIGEAATQHYEQSRDRVATFINAKHREEIIFTKGTTEGINFIANTWALDHLKPGDQIVLTQAEHHANLLPWQLVANRTGAELVFIPIDKKTYQVVNPGSILSSKTKLVAVTMASNVLGPIWDTQHNELESFIAQSHAVGAVVLVDAAQAVMHKKVDVQTLGADFLVFSGHKMMAPTGIGVLYMNKKLHESVEPYQLGGSMIHEVTFDHATWAPSPHKYEAGTPPIAEVIGLGAAIEYINQNINWNELHHHESQLSAQLIDGLKTIPEVTIIGNIPWLKHEGHVVSFTIDGMHTHDAAALLGFEGIAVRAGHLCAQPLVNHLGIESLLRVSIAAYNTSDDIDAFLRSFKTCLTSMKQSLA